jgi:hypothetical protein
MAAAAVTKACSDLHVHVEEARARKRLRCASRTTWGHQNLCDYVRAALPAAGWRVIGPPPPCEAPNGPTQYPPEGGVRRGPYSHQVPISI